MALVDSLLTAMVRANGDALVMHVGERPYVVRASGTIDLSTHGLNLDAMTGMLSQLLPADAQNALQEFGAVEHQLPSKDDDRFTVVAAQGGDDIWIEIRRRRKLPEVAVAIPEPVPEPVAEAAVPPPVVETAEPVEVAPPAERVEHVEPAHMVEPAPVLHEESSEHELPAAAEPEPPAEPIVASEPVIVFEAAASLEPAVVPEPVVAESPAIVETVVTPEPAAIFEPDVILESVMIAEPVAAAQLTAVVESIEVESVAMAQPEAIEHEVVESLAAAAEPVAIIESAQAAEPVAIAEPVAVPAAVVMHEPVVMVEPAAIPEPVAIAEPPMTVEPPAHVEPLAVAEPEPIGDESVPVEVAINPPAAAEVSGPAPVAVAPELVEMAAAAPVTTTMQAPAATAVEPPIIEPPAVAPLASGPPVTEPPASVQPAPQPWHAADSVVLPMTRPSRIEMPQPMPSSRLAGIERLLRMAGARGASALYLTSESRPYLRVEGDIRILEEESVLTKADVEAAALEIGPEGTQELVRQRESTEWFAELPELGRIRCTSFQDHHGPGVLFRMIATRAATAEQLGLSREVQALATEAEGLVLVAGPRASGKTTLMSALVDLVNRQRADHVITLERQIRLVHDNRTALVSQREIRGGADEALSAARAALRESPDVLVVDDLGSAQMVPLLLEAAGQGLLVMVSITAPSTAAAVERFVDLAPPDMRAAVLAAMSETFRGAVAQVLLKKTGGGRVTAREVLLGTASVTRLIAEGQLAQLPLALESGRKHGMMPMTDALLSFVQNGAVDPREAFRKAQDRERFIAGLKRAGIDTSVVERLA